LGGHPRLGTESWVRLAYFGPLILLAFCGHWYGKRHWWELAPLWLFILVFPLPYYVTHVDRGRYSYPVEPLVVLLAAIPLAAWYSHTSRAVRLLHVDAAAESIDKINPQTNSR
jgi:hypothetical protein